MLTLGESRNKGCSSDRKRSKAQKKRRYGKKQKRKTSKNVEISNAGRKSKKVRDSSDSEYSAEIKESSYEQSTSELTLQSSCESPNSLTHIEATESDDKYVIITLLQPDLEEGTLSQSLVNLASPPETDDGVKHRTCSKMAKKVILLPPNVVIDSSVNVKTEFEGLMNEEEFIEPLCKVNVDEFEPLPTDSKEQIEISNWIKRCQPQVLCQTDCGRPYVKCPACNATFFKATSFQRHLSSHLYKSYDDSLYICTFCKQGDKDGCAVFKHLFTHQDQCEVCNVKLSRKNSYKKHWDALEDSFSMTRDLWGRFVCGLCKVGFDLSHHLEKHFFTHLCKAKKTPQCNSCSGLFESELALENHKCLRCPVCDQICESVPRLKAHTRSAKHYLFCSTCSYEFILAVDYEKHLDLHKKIYRPHKDYHHCLEAEDGKSFQCEICGKICNLVSCLVMHIHQDHKIPNVHKNSENDGMGEGKEQEEGFDFIKSELKCEIDFETACEQVLEVQENRTVLEKEDLQENEPVSLCWNRYSIDEADESKTE